MAIYIESIPNRNSPPAILLRYAKRNGKRIERKTLANLSKTPAFIVDAIRILLKGGITFSRHRQLPRPGIHRPTLVAARTCRGCAQFGFANRTAAYFASNRLASTRPGTGGHHRPHPLAGLQARHCQSAFAANRRQLAGHFAQARYRTRQ